MEKMEEINIQVKSHMSLVDDDQIDRLYKHIGVVNRDLVTGSDEGNNADQSEKQESQLVRKSIPRIIRKLRLLFMTMIIMLMLIKKRKRAEKLCAYIK